MTAPRRRKPSTVEVPWGYEDADFTVECSVEPFVPARTYGPPERCAPAEGGDVTVEMVYDEDGNERRDLVDVANRGEEFARIEELAFEEAEEAHIAAYEAACEDAADAARDERRLG